MIVIPAINAASPEAVAALLEKTKTFLKAGDWLHFDVSQFNLGMSDIPRMSDIQILNVETHFMRPDYEELLKPWLEVGAKRIIVQVEILKDLEFLLETAGKFGAEVGLAVAPETAVEELNVYFNKVKFFQVLAVSPGPSGQDFNQSVLEKIKWLRSRLPDAIIEVDGGINPKTVKMAKEAGANMVVSASYIFNNPNPAEAYGILTRQKT